MQLKKTDGLEYRNSHYDPWVEKIPVRRSVLSYHRCAVGKYGSTPAERISRFRSSWLRCLTSRLRGADCRSITGLPSVLIHIVSVCYDLSQRGCLVYETSNELAVPVKARAVIETHARAEFSTFVQRQDGRLKHASKTQSVWIEIIVVHATCKIR